MRQFHAARPFILAQLRRPAAGTGIRIGNPPAPLRPRMVYWIFGKTVDIFM